jgi:hypothetical protein
VDEERGQFGNPEEVSCLPLQEMTRGLVKTQQTEKTLCVKK